MEKKVDPLRMVQHREAVLDIVSTLADTELCIANELYDKFHSTHEAFAVLREEIEEASTEILEAMDNMNAMWINVKENRSIKNYSSRVEWNATFAASELIQVIAMARKLRKSLYPEEEV